MAGGETAEFLGDSRPEVERGQSRGLEEGEFGDPRIHWLAVIKASGVGASKGKIQVHHMSIGQEDVIGHDQIGHLDLQARLFPELADKGGGQALAGLHVPARHHPVAFASPVMTGHQEAATLHQETRDPQFKRPVHAGSLDTRHTGPIVPASRTK